MSKFFESGQRVKWTYYHSLGRNYTRRTKTGTFIVMKLVKRYVTHGPYMRSTEIAKVKFPENRHMSEVPVRQLELVE